MKLQKLHLFLILLTVLILSSLGIGVMESFGLIEGNQNITDSTVALNSVKNRKAETPNSALENGDSHNPFNNNKESSVEFRNLNTGKKEMNFSDENGITKNEIPHGKQHLYVLKSEIVPPVCPKCPDCPKPTIKNLKKECPPCPRPERCPEPAFTCKKVPNYTVSSVDSVLPSPMFMNGSGDGSSGNGSGAGAGSSGPMPILNSFAKFS